MNTRRLYILAVLLVLAGCSHPQMYPLQSKTGRQRRLVFTLTVNGVFLLSPPGSYLQM
ncbi:Uncharacterised protein [Citrobacter koseri]|uniref:Lipoprotein n=1 Tax=Citrobacter koseri TaxID=545 RepID=A0A2X2XGU5_CITKO|nr:Uncharacterised protein [Citrobacter koseri]